MVNRDDVRRAQKVMRRINRRIKRSGPGGIAWARQVMTDANANNTIRGTRSKVRAKPKRRMLP
jgi:hypothetical protein